MFNVRELRNQRNKLLKDAQALCLKRDKTAEDLESAKRMLDDAETVERTLAGCEAEMRAAPPCNDPSGGNPESRGETPGKENFRRYVQYGDPRGLQEQRDLLAGSGSGAYIVPQDFDPVLVEAQKMWGQIIGELRQVETDNGVPRKMGLMDDVDSDLHESGEPASVSESDPPLAGLLTETDMLDTGVIKVSVQELQDSAFDIDGLVRNVFGKRYYRGLTKKITLGSTSGNIASLVSGANNAVVSAGPTTIAWTDITKLYAALDPAYQVNGKFSCNSRTVGKLLGVTDTLGRPLYVPAPTADGFDRLLGKPVVLNQYLDDIEASNSPTTDVVALQFGDFKEGYLLRLVKPGLAIVRLNERYMDTLEVGFIGYVRAGGIVTDAGTHPIVNLVQAN